MDSGAENYLRYLKGDDDGIGEIIKEYKDGLILFLNGYVKNIHIAEDLTEDTFFKLVVKKPKYKSRCSFKTWLYTIGRNSALNYLKHSGKFTDKPFEDFENILRDEAELEKSYLIEERKIAVHKALGKLNGDYCQVLYLTVFEELTNEEAAAVMKKNKRQIENLVYRAKKALRAELEREGFVYEEL